MTEAYRQLPLTACDPTSRNRQPCEVCGKIFRFSPCQAGTRRTCSVACARALKGVEKICAGCGKPFRAERSDADRARFCSWACRWLGRSTRQVCVICGKTYAVAASGAPRRRTCSKACHVVLKRGGRPLVRSTCAHCGKEMVRNPSRGNRPYCSLACYAASMRKPGTEWSRRSPEQRARKRETNLAYKAAHRAEINARQLAYHAAHPEVAARARVARRLRKGARVDLTAGQWRAIVAAYDGRCAYCGRRPEKLTMDHVVPLARGGTHTAANIVPACRSCNCRKRTALWTPRPPLFAVGGEIERALR